MSGDSGKHRRREDGDMRCPWCRVVVHPDVDGRIIRHVLHHTRRDRVADPTHEYTFLVRYCSACDRPSAYVQTAEKGAKPEDERCFYPLDHGRPPVPPDVPDPYASDYREACSVLPFSAQASAALARRVLQMLIRGQANIKEKDLYQEIDKVIPTLPTYVAGSLHLLRNIGNFAAHPQEDIAGMILPVERDEADLTLDVIESLFDHYFVGPAKAAAIKASFNANKAVPAGKPPVP